MISLHSRRTLLAMGVTAALVTSGGLSADAAKPKPPKPFRNTTIVVQKSVGGIALDASVAATTKIFGAKHCSTGGCNYTGSNNSYTLFASFAAKKKGGTPVVTSVQFQAQKLAASARVLHTNRKIGIGSTLTQLKKAYSKIKKTEGPGVGVHYYRLGSGKTDTSFVVNSKNRVFEIDLFTS